MEGCGHEVLRVVYAGKFLASILLKLQLGNQVPLLGRSEGLSPIPINQSEDCSSAEIASEVFPSAGRRKLAS